MEDNYDDDFEEYDLETSVRKSLIQDPSPSTTKERFSAAQKNFGNQRTNLNNGVDKVDEEISVESGFQDTYDDNDDLF